MFDEQLRQFGAHVDALMRGRSLGRMIVREMMRQVLLNEQPELHQGALLAAITAKGPTPEEIAGCWEAIYEFDTAKVKPNVEQLVENCGTGMDEVKTYNISTAAAIIAAACGAHIARHGARALTSRCGTVDVAEALGVDVECEPEVVRKSIERVGLGLFNGMSLKVHQHLARVLSQIRFGTILNISASLANPASPSIGVRGVYSKELLEFVADVMQEIGYKRGMVFCGTNADGSRSMDEISSLGETFVVEFDGGRLRRYTLGPESFGVDRAEDDDVLASGDVERDAFTLLRVISGKEHGPKLDVACANAAPILYLTQNASSLEQGFELAMDAVENGEALKKLEEWVSAQNESPEKGERRLRELLQKL